MPGDPASLVDTQLDPAHLGNLGARSVDREPQVGKPNIFESEEHVPQRGAVVRPDFRRSDRSQVRPRCAILGAPLRDPYGEDKVRREGPTGPRRIASPWLRTSQRGCISS